MHVQKMRCPKQKTKIKNEVIKMARLLCPTSAKAAKTVNKFICILEKSRKLLDEGTPIDQLGYRNPPVSVDLKPNLYDSDSD